MRASVVVVSALAAVLGTASACALIAAAREDASARRARRVAWTNAWNLRITPCHQRHHRLCLRCILSRTLGARRDELKDHIQSRREYYPYRRGCQTHPECRWQRTRLCNHIAEHQLIARLARCALQLLVQHLSHPQACVRLGRRGGLIARPLHPLFARGCGAPQHKAHAQPTMHAVRKHELLLHLLGRCCSTRGIRPVRKTTTPQLDGRLGQAEANPRIACAFVLDLAVGRDDGRSEPLQSRRLLLLFSRLLFSCIGVGLGVLGRLFLVSGGAKAFHIEQRTARCQTPPARMQADQRTPPLAIRRLARTQLGRRAAQQIRRIARRSPLRLEHHLEIAQPRMLECRRRLHLAPRLLEPVSGTARIVVVGILIHVVPRTAAGSSGCVERVRDSEMASGSSTNSSSRELGARCAKMPSGARAAVLVPDRADCPPTLGAGDPILPAAAVFAAALGARCCLSSMPSSWCAWIELKCATSRFASTLFRSATNSASPIVPPTTSSAGLSSGSSSSFSSPAGLCSSSSDCASGEVSRSRLRSRSAVRKREKVAALRPQSMHILAQLLRRRRARRKDVGAVRGDVLQLALALKRSCNAEGGPSEEEATSGSV